MVRQSATPKPAEKQRLRDAITRHVDHFLECGGKIRVIETPQYGSSERHLSAWHRAHELDEPFD